jgi:hypothetical protein
MKRIYILIFISVIHISTFAQEDRKIVFDDLVYDPFFSASIIDNEGETFKISRIAFFDEFNERKFFFWVRRNSGLYSLSFKNIKKITFRDEDFSDDRYIGFTRCNLELMSGEIYEIYIKTTGHIEGFDEEFASPVTFYMHYKLITSIEFFNVGDYLICPFCENVYFDKDITNCIYDKTPLIEGVLSLSDKED